MTEMVAEFQRNQAGSLPDLLGFTWTHAAEGRVEGEFTVLRHHLAPHGFLHGGTIVALADSACGFGCQAMLPRGASNFTTAELKANYLGTAREGIVTVRAQVVHAGRTTQVWDAEVASKATGKRIALFRCTQIILYPHG